jgi:hypothetical protein
MGNFYTFLRLSSRIFCHVDDFVAKTHELLASILCWWRPYCAVGIPADDSTVVR